MNLNPNIEMLDELYIRGTDYDRQMNQIHFVIFRCDNASKTRDKDDPEYVECASKEDTDEYIKNLEVEAIVINKRMNYLKFGEEPTFIYQSTIGSTLLDTEKSTTYEVELGFNGAELEDDFF